MAKQDSNFIIYHRKKSALFKRLNSEGRYPQFAKERKELVDKGFPIKVAWIAVGLRYPPLDGSPPEFTQGDYESAVGLIQDQGTAAELRVKIHNDAAGTAPQSDVPKFIDVQRVQMALAEENGRKQAQTKRQEAWDNLRREVRRIEQRKGFKRATISQQTIWAFENAGTPPQELKAAEIPGSGALRLLRQMDDDVFYCDVAKSVISKYATKEDSDGLGHSDDGRKILNVMSQLDDVDTELLDEQEISEYLQAKAEEEIADQEIVEMQQQPELYGVGEGEPQEEESPITIDPPEEGQSDGNDPRPAVP